MNQVFLTGIVLLLLLPIMLLVVTAAATGCLRQITSTSASTVGLKHDPSPPFYNVGPAILLIVQGYSVLSSISQTDPQFVVNTNWDLFNDFKKKYCLLNKQITTRKYRTGEPICY
jgi:hypothetical protein